MSLVERSSTRKDKSLPTNWQRVSLWVGIDPDNVARRAQLDMQG